ncbi:hypothetical protein SLS58_006484 [Diplodia intermedia]|uniref:C2H2-type domain-containing protein n=1 Tax=Diplodia intermedia TaxID=856260 RepID=A0ABR3TMP3_9PEZI
MKEHLYRKHSLPEHHCYFCYEPFSDRQALFDHLSPSHGGSQCSGPQRKPDMLLSTAQERQLRQRSERVPEVEKWRGIFRILFQTDEETLTSIPSPYVDEYGTGPANLDQLHQSNVASGSPTFSETDRRFRTDILNHVGQQLRQRLENRMTIEVESLISESRDLIDQRRRQLFPDPSAAPELHAEQPGDASVLAHTYAGTFQGTPDQASFYRLAPDANPGDLPSPLFPPETLPRQAMNGGPNSFGPTWPQLDTAGELNNDLSPYWGQQHWDRGFGGLHPIGETDTSVFPNPLQAGMYPNMEPDNQHAPGVLPENSHLGFNGAPSTRLNPDISHGMAAYPQQYPAYGAPQNVGFDESLLSTIGTDMHGHDAWSSNHHDAGWGGTQATTMDGYAVQSEKNDALQDGFYAGLDAPSPD